MQEGKTGVVERMKADGLAAMVEALRLYGEIDQMKRGLERILARYVMRGEPSVLSVGDLSVEAAGRRSVETRRGRAVNFFIDGDMVQTIILRPELSPDYDDLDYATLEPGPDRTSGRVTSWILLDGGGRGWQVQTPYSGRTFSIDGEFDNPATAADGVERLE